MSARQLRRLMLFTLFGVGQCIFLLSYVFLVQKIQVQGNSLVPSSVIISETSLQVGDYYWTYWLLGLPQHVSSIPQLKDASVTFCPGGLVVIEVQERIPVAMVNTSNPRIPWVAVDEQGAILGPCAERGQLPKLVVEGGVPVAGHMAPAPIAAMLTAQSLFAKHFGQELMYYSFDNTGNVSLYVYVLGAPTRVIVGHVDSLEAKSDLVLALVAAVKKDGKPAKRIDVRFAQPVVAPLNPPKPSPSPSPEAVIEAEPAPADDPAAAEEPSQESASEEQAVEYYGEGEAVPADPYADAAPAEPSYSESEPYYGEPAPAEPSYSEPESEPYYGEPAPAEPSYSEPEPEPYYGEPVPAEPSYSEPAY